MPDMSNAQLALLAAASYTTPEHDTIDGVTAVADSFLIWLNGKDNEWKTAHRVPCPACRAVSGNVCRNDLGSPLGTPHPARLDAAKEANK